MPIPLGVLATQGAGPLAAILVDYLVIAGGGSGGLTVGGGGGAGGMRSSTSGTGGSGSLETALTLSTGTNYTVTVGAGASPTSNNGSNSIFSTITSTGGGGGGNYDNNPGGSGKAGGSGGGGAGQGVSGTVSGGAASPSNQGFAGGTGIGNGSSGYAGGGGGGASAVGSNATAGNGAAGGAGRSNNITGVSVTYAGGGGGASDSVQGAGGAGGGGAGGRNPSIGAGDGTANTGGGGGGRRDTNSGGAGGSGLVVIRYPDTYALTVGAGLTYTTKKSGSLNVASFTSGTDNISFSTASTGAYELLETIILGSATSAVDFTDLNTNYGSTYQHLQIRLVARSSSNEQRTRMRLNGDSGQNYATHLLLGNGSSISAAAGTSFNVMSLNMNDDQTNVFSAGIIDIFDAFKTTKNKTIRHLGGIAAATKEVSLTSGVWLNTAAITTITLRVDSGNFEVGSRFSVYGMRSS